MLSGFSFVDRSGSDLVESSSLGDATWLRDELTAATFVLVQVDPLSGLWVVRSRFEPGSQVQLHLHSGPVFAYTINGQWGYPEAGVWCKPGDYLVEKAGTVHSLLVTGDEVVDVLFFMFGSIIYFDENRNAVRIEDWRSVLDEYVAGCEALGQPTNVIGAPAKLDRPAQQSSSQQAASRA